jgi:hypothetical protein
MSQSNPLLYNTKFITIDSTIIELSQQSISKYFTDIYVLVKKNDKPCSINFYMKEVNNETFIQMKDNLILWKVSVNILKNKKMFDRICIFTKEYCEMFNQFGFTFNDNNIVLPILNISFENIIKYLNNSDGYTLDDFYNLILLSMYFDENFANIKFQKKLQKNIKSLKESNYWVDNNWVKHITIQFQKRNICKKFKDFTNVKNTQLLLTEKDKQTLLNKEHYNNIFANRHKFVDPSNNIMNNGFKMYNIPKLCNYSKDDIYNLCKNLDNETQYYLVTHLMVSKEYCHLIVNNEKVLDLIKNEFTSKAPLFRYLMGFPWQIFYLEESIKKRNITINDRFIFDINTASKLPIYPFSINCPKNNPYMPIMVSDKALKAHENIGGIKNYKRNDESKQYCNQGICTLDEFRYRLNLFVTNNIDNNLFDNIEWKKWKVVICGSVMTACIQKHNPLVNLFDTKLGKFFPQPMDIKLIRYFNEYYAKSDIDIMFSLNNTLEYMDAIENFFNQIVINTCKIYPYAEPEHVKLNKHFQLHFSITQDWIKKNIVNESITYDYIYNNIENIQVILLFKPFIEDYYKNYLKTELKKYNEWFIKKSYIDFFKKIDEYDIKIYIIYQNTEPTIKINYKYKITSPHFNHPLELFKISETEQMGAISQFHLPCVRALYNGDNVYMTPSCITAHLTFMNIDIKYVTCKNNPFDIINKYRMRGFGIWLNKNEKNDLLKFSLEDPFWKKIYDGNAINLGCLPLSHKIFHPRKINPDEYNDVQHVCLENGYNDDFNGCEISCICDLHQENKNTDKFEYYGIEELVNVNSDGKNIELQKWIIEAYYESYKLSLIKVK